MKIEGVFFIRLIASNEKDFDFLKSKYINAGICIEISDYLNITPLSIPTIFFGKEYMSLIDKDKDNIVEILDQNIEDNVETLKKLDILIEKFAYKFSPYKSYAYDYLLDGDLFSFLNNKLDSEKNVFIYFYKKCLYVYSDFNLISINIESIYYVNNEFKKTITNFVRKYKCILYSYNNTKNYVDNLSGFDFLTFENILWCKEYKIASESLFFNFFCDHKIHKNIPYLISLFIDQNPLTEEEFLSIKRFFKKDIITDWLSTRTVFFDKKIDGLFLSKKENLFYTSFTYSNKRTITGRINCHDEQLNIQLLPKKSEIKDHVVSRYKNGKIVIFDYISFETRIAMFETKNFDFIKKFKEKDIHTHTSKIIFEKNNIDPNEREIGKTFNHSLLFGAGEEKLKSIIKTANQNVVVIYNKITKELEPIINLSNYIINFAKEKNYIVNSYGTIIKPRKLYASFNNYIQSTSSDIVIEKLFLLKEYIKNKKINFLYQVYDSYVFDFDESEIEEIDSIKNILSQVDNLYFPMSVYSGPTLLKVGIL